MPREALIGQRSIDLGLFAEPADRVRATDLLKREGRIREYEMVVRLALGEGRTVLLSVEPFKV